MTIIAVFLVFLQTTQIGADAINLDKAEQYNLIPLNLAKNSQIIATLGDGKVCGKYFFVPNFNHQFLYFEYTTLGRLKTKQLNLRGYLDRDLFVALIDERKDISPTVTFIPNKNPTTDPKLFFSVLVKITKLDYLAAKDCLPDKIFVVQ